MVNQYLSYISSLASFAQYVIRYILFMFLMFLRVGSPALLSASILQQPRAVHLMSMFRSQVTERGVILSL